MFEVMITLLEASIVISVISLIYIAFTPILRKKITAKGRYYTWLVIVIGLIIPIRFHPLVSTVNINSLTPTMNLGTSQSVELNTFSVSWTSILIGVWLTGMAVFIVIHMVRHVRFCKTLKRWSVKNDNDQLYKLFGDIKDRMQIRRHVDLQICPAINSPMMIGFFRPIILLPTSNLPLDELSLILKHELVHYQRKDVWYKTIVLIATAVHWFNPFVYVIARQISMECEMSCDEEVIKKLDINGRKKYVEAIINAVRKPIQKHSKLSTSLSSGKQELKQRVFSIMEVHNKNHGIVIFITIVLVTFSTGMMINTGTPETAVHSGDFVSRNTSDHESVNNEEGNKGNISTGFLSKNPIQRKDRTHEKTEVTLIEIKEETNGVSNTYNRMEDK